MLQFCQQLYDDISENLDAWARWYEHVWDDDESEFDFDTSKEELIKKLARLKELIAENEEYFGENHCFL